MSARQIPSPSPRPADDAARLLRKVYVHESAGKLDLAVKSCRDYLRSAPDDAERWHLLGSMEYRLGKTRDAVRALKRAVELRPAVPELRNDLAGLLLADHQLEKAEQCYRDLIASRPEFTPARYNLASLLFQQNRLKDCVDCLLEVTLRTPEWAEAHFNLAVAREHLGQLPLALQDMLRARRLDPGLPGIAMKLGQIYRKLRRHGDAVREFRAALAENPADTDAVLGLASAHAAEGMSDDAIDLLSGFLGRNSGDPRPAVMLGDLCASKGENGKAEHYYDVALHADPANADAIYGKTWARKFDERDTVWIARLETLASGKPVTERARTTALFALGKIYDDCGRFDDAFARVRLANEACRNARRSNRYDRAGQVAYVDALIETFSRDWIAQASATLGFDSQRPLFVLGMPRSGTTLAEQIIASHPDAHGAGELLYFASLENVLPAKGDGGQGFPRCLARLDPDLAVKIGSGYLELLDRHSDKALRVVDKNPFNFLHLGLIAGLFPNARVIHCRRNPLDVCLSVYFQSFKDDINFSSDLLDIGHYYLQYRRLMDHWQEVIPGRIVDLQYEQLVEQPESKTRELIDACGLEWDPACLAFHATPRDVKTASSWQVRQPIYRTSRERWKNYAKYLESLQELLAGCPD